MGCINLSKIWLCLQYNRKNVFVFFKTSKTARLTGVPNILNFPEMSFCSILLYKKNRAALDKLDYLRFNVVSLG